MPVQGDGIPFYYSQKGTWYVWFNGKRVSLKIQGKGNRKQAYEALGRLGTTDIPIPQQAGDTIDVVLQAYLHDVESRNLKPNSVRTIHRFVVPFVEANQGKPISTIKGKDVEAFASKPTWSTATRHTAIGTVLGMLRWAGYPIRVKIPPMVSRGIKAVIPEGDYLKVIEQAKGDFKQVLRFLWLTGCRPTEALTLCAEHYHNSGVCILPVHKTDSTGKPRILYLSAESIEIVLEQTTKYGSGFMFRNGTGSPITLNNAVNILWRLNKRLGTKVTLYGFRHTLATEALANGIPEAHVAELLGHCSTKMLSAHYSHLSAKAKVMVDSLNRVRG